MSGEHHRMAEGSHATWGDMPRTCHGCGGALRITRDDLWLDTMHRWSWHARCKIDALRADSDHQTNTQPGDLITSPDDPVAPDDGYNHGGATLRELRHQRRLSLRDLEQQTGVNRATWSQIEHGRLLPDRRHIAALAAALNVPYEAWVIRVSLEAEVPSG